MKHRVTFLLHTASQQIFGQPVTFVTFSQHSPLMLGLINDQQDLELLGEGRRRGRLLHKASSRCGRLFDHVGDGAEGAEEAGGSTRGGGGLGLLGLLGQLGWTTLLWPRRTGRHLGWSRSFCWGEGRGRS